MRAGSARRILVAIGLGWASIHGPSARAEDAFTGEGWEGAIDAPEMIEAFGTLRDEIDRITGDPAKGDSCPKDGAEALPAGPCALPAPECKTFFNPDCSLGALGASTKIDLNLMVTNRSNAKSGKPSGVAGHFIGNPPSDIELVCPKYGTFDALKKANFWVWVLMQLAYEESGCGLDKKNESNRRAVGLFQLDRDDASRRGLRPAECTDAFIAKAFPGQTIKDDGPNLRCATAMLSVQLARRGTATAETREDLRVLSTGRLVSRMSYWQELRNVGKRLLSGIKSYPGCL